MELQGKYLVGILPKGWATWQEVEFSQIIGMALKIIPIDISALCGLFRVLRFAWKPGPFRSEIGIFNMLNCLGPISQRHVWCVVMTNHVQLVECNV